MRAGAVLRYDVWNEPLHERDLMDAWGLWDTTFMDAFRCVSFLAHNFSFFLIFWGSFGSFVVQCDCPPWSTRNILAHNKNDSKR